MVFFNDEKYKTSLKKITSYEIVVSKFGDTVTGQKQYNHFERQQPRKT